MRDYDKIRAARSDFTDDLVHMTSSLQRLDEIVFMGYLKPFFGYRERRGDDGEWTQYPTVKGPYPAVCFSEMPLSQVKALDGLRLKTPRYSAYGISFEKKQLAKVAAAQPVIYSDASLIGDEVAVDHPDFQEGCEVYEGALSLELQHRYVRLDLTREGAAGPVDWTHEREWRARSADETKYGFAGVPLYLGRWTAAPTPNFRFFVATRGDSDYLKKRITMLRDVELRREQKGYRRAYLAALENVEVVVLDEL